MKKDLVNERLYSMLLIVKRLQDHVNGMEGQILFGMLLDEILKLRKEAK